MPIVSKRRALSWSLSLLSSLVVPGSLWGQQLPAKSADGCPDGFATAIATDSAGPEPMTQIGFVPNWRQLLSLLAQGDDGNDPRKRFFVSYEQMLWGISPTLAPAGSDAKPAHASQQASPAASGPFSLGNDSKTFSTTALETLGTGVIGSLIPNPAAGSRLEFGRMETDNTGWSVSILEFTSSSPSAPSPDGNRAARAR